MSSGKFTRSKYETDSGAIVNARVQPETITTANPAPTGAVTAGYPSVRISGGKRKTGINARSISVKWTGTVPDGYDPNGLLRVPVLTRAAYTGFALGGTFTYLGQSTVIVGKNPEFIR